MSFFWYATLLLYFKNSTLYFCTCIIQLYFSRFFKKRITHIHTRFVQKSKFLTCIHYIHIFIWNTNLEILITNHTILRVNIKIDKHKTGFCHSEAFSFSNIKFIKNIWLFIFTWFFQKKIKHYGKTFGKQSGSNHSRSSRYHYIVILNLMK